MKLDFCSEVWWANNFLMRFSNGSAVVESRVISKFPPKYFKIPPFSNSVNIFFAFSSSRALINSSRRRGAETRLRRLASIACSSHFAVFCSISKPNLTEYLIALKILVGSSIKLFL